MGAIGYGRQTTQGKYSMIVSSWDRGHFLKDVDRALFYGWEPIGGMAVETVNQTTHYYQLFKVPDADLNVAWEQEHEDE